jgi:mono/diheme cytochrome c family protein
MTFERNGATCAACHTSQGFAARGGKSDMVNLDAAISAPAPVNCRTCHNIHETGTAADWALTVSAPVTLAINGDTLDLGKANLCANCHQPRAVAIPTTGDFEVTSSRFGPHHGPQSTMLTGKATYLDYKSSSVHAMIPDGCITCHMAEPYGKQSGDHTWKMAYEYHGHEVPNVAGCITCHPELEDDATFDRNGLVTEVEALIEEAKVALIATGILLENGSTTVPGTYSAELAGACFDYKTVVEDRSKGIHNPGFTKALLKNAIAIANAQ